LTRCQTTCSTSVAAQAAALRLPLDVAAALGVTQEERDAADVLMSQSASFEADVQLAAAVAQTPEELARTREALARAPAQSPSDAAPYTAREREADAALLAAMTTTAFRLAQARQLIVRKILFSRFDALVRGARVSDAFARLFSGQRLDEFKLAQAESAARFALRHDGQKPADRLLGATRALAAAITALVAERAERDKLECAVKKLSADSSAMSISPQRFQPARLRAARRRAPLPLVRAQASGATHCATSFLVHSGRRPCWSCWRPRYCCCWRSR
jgi:hypothetical protein